MAKRKDVRDILEDESLDTDGKVKKFLELIHAETDGLRDENDSLKSQLNEANGKVTAAEQAKADADSALESLRNENAERETASAKKTAYTALLKSAGVSEKRIGTILKVTDLKEIELNKDGSIKGADKLTESVKSEYADFIDSVSIQGAKVSTPPVNSASGRSKQDIMSDYEKTHDRDALRAAIAANPSAFGQKG